MDGKQAWCTMAKILVVENNPDVNKLISLVLSREGHIVNSISDNEDILEKIKECQPDIVTLEPFDMARSHKELLEKLFHLDTIASKIIAITTCAEEKTVSLCKHGFDGYVKKPFDVFTLINAINEVNA